MTTTQMILTSLVSISLFLLGTIFTLLFKKVDLDLVKRNLRVQNEVNLLYQIEAEVSSRYKMLTSESIELDEAKSKELILAMIEWSGKYPHRKLPKYSGELIDELTSIYRKGFNTERLSEHKEKVESCFFEFILAIQDALEKAEDPNIAFE